MSGARVVVAVRGVHAMGDRFPVLTLGPEDRDRVAAEPDRDRALDLAAHATPAYGGVLVRARYTEDLLAEAMERGIRQYVLLGAGMDTFAQRRSDLRERLEIVEIDHPATQALKRVRLAEAGIAIPANLHLVAADLALERAGRLGGALRDALPRRLPPQGPDGAAGGHPQVVE